MSAKIGVTEGAPVFCWNCQPRVRTRLPPEVRPVWVKFPERPTTAEPFPEDARVVARITVSVEVADTKTTSASMRMNPTAPTIDPAAFSGFRLTSCVPATPP